MKEFPEINFSIADETKGKLSRLPFDKMKERILGKKYELTLIAAGDKRLASLNRIYRGKKGTTDILSFPISEHKGEIYINPLEAARQAESFDMNRDQFIGFLFIHGLLHLKGYTHGSTMEREERKFKKVFGF